MIYPVSAHRKRICDQRSVTSPGKRFRAHQCGTPAACNADRTDTAGVEFFALHIVGKPAKAHVMPTKIRGIFFRLAQTAKIIDVCIGNLRPAQRPRELLFVELRIMPGPGNGAYIYQGFDPIGFQKCDEFLSTMR